MEKWEIEELSAIHKWLDEQGVPRKNDIDTYSIVGRIKWVINQKDIEASELETKLLRMIPIPKNKKKNNSNFGGGYIGEALASNQ